MIQTNEYGSTTAYLQFVWSSVTKIYLEIENRFLKDHDMMIDELDHTLLHFAKIYQILFIEKVLACLGCINLM